MAVHNASIAETLRHVADLLEIEGANPFRIRAYRRAAQTVEDLLDRCPFDLWIGQMRFGVGQARRAWLEGKDVALDRT